MIGLLTDPHVRKAIVSREADGQLGLNKCLDRAGELLKGLGLSIYPRKTEEYSTAAT